MNVQLIQLVYGVNVYWSRTMLHLLIGLCHSLRTGVVVLLTLINENERRLVLWALSNDSEMSSGCSPVERIAVKRSPRKSMRFCWQNKLIVAGTGSCPHNCAEWYLPLGLWLWKGLKCSLDIIYFYSELEQGGSNPH